MSVRRLAVCAVVIAGCGDPEPAPRPTPPPVVAPAPEPPPDLSLGAGYEMRGVVRDDHVVLIPIIATGTVATTSYVTLQDALASHTATVREMPGDMVVEQLRVRNRGALPLFVMSGELVFGGQQDRVLAETRIIAPGETVDVSVRCVEREREDGSPSFHASHLIAELALRRAIVHEAQADVWEQVDAINSRLGTQNHTSTYRKAAGLQLTPPSSTHRDHLLAELAKHPARDRMVGLVVVLGGKIIAIERFASPALYQALEGELVASYAASDHDVVQEGRLVTPAAVREFAQHAWGLQTTDASYVLLRPNKDALLDKRDPWQ